MSALDEKLDGRVSKQVCQLNSRPRIRTRQRRNAPVCLGTDPQALAAGRQQPHLRTADEQSLSQIGAGINQVFAVVEHE